MHELICMYMASYVPGADLGFSEGGAKPSSGSLKQGSTTGLAIDYLVFEVSKSKVQSIFDRILKEANKMYVLLKQGVW